MTATVKILLLCGLSAFLLAKVDGSHSRKDRKSNEAAEDTDMGENEDRGIISDILRPSHTHAVQPQQQFVNVPAPPFIADQALAPVFQIPQDVVTGQTHQHKPSLIGGLLNILRSRELKSSEEKEKSSEEKVRDRNDGRGILGNLIGGILPSNNIPVRPVAVNIPAPSFFPEQALAPTFQVPTNVQGQQTIVQNRPSLLGGLLNILGSGEQPIQSAFNQNWLNYGMQKCARIDPKSLTAILPTTANGLRVPKMYYFQNDTTGKLTWQKAQEWCTARGMSLLTVNDANENKVIVDRLRQIMAGSTPGTISAVPALNQNPTAWWIGLNRFSPGNIPTWVGDGTSTFTDWHTTGGVVEPDTPAAADCATYNQVSTVDNIRMDARPCLTATEMYRYICEVSDECTALFMSRFPTSYFHHHNQGHGHIHYSPGGVLPPVGGGG